MNRQEARKKMLESYERSMETLNLMYLVRDAIDRKDDVKLDELKKILDKRDGQ